MGVCGFPAVEDGDKRLLIFGVHPGSKASKTGRIGAEMLINELIQDNYLNNDNNADDSDN